MTTWYYARNGQQFGPHTEDELRQFLADGRVTPGEMIWKAGLPNWVAAHTVFAPPVPMGGPPPPPPAQLAPPPYAQPQVPQQPYHQSQPYAQPNPQAKQRVAYVLLGFFLGGFGIHNFYAGYTGRGIAQLLILLFGWILLGIPYVALGIWVLVEIIAVTKDANGVPFT